MNKIRHMLLAGALGLMAAPASFAQDKGQDVAYQNDPFYKALQEQAATIRDYLLQKNYKYVGVLKFLVKKGNKPLSDNAGTLNMAMADRLEVALVLASPDRKQGESDYRLNILRHASAALADQGFDDNHLTPAGRKKFFGKIFKFALAWNDDEEREVNANAFVTGEVTFTDDLSKMSIKIQVFDRSGELIDLVKDVSFESPLHVLAEVGYSYMLPLLTADNPNPKPVPLMRNPWKEGYVKLRILYDGVEQPVSDTGDAAEPDKDAKVVFEIENTSKDQTFAVVLRVNGQNTLFQESTHEPRDSRKWIVPPGKTRRIEGFQFDDKEAIPFKVESPEESKANEVRYGVQAGTIHMICFQGTVVDKDPYADIVKNREEKQREIVGIAKGFLRNSKEEPRSLEALKKKLLALSDRDRDDRESKGYIGAGTGKIDNPVQWQFFKYESDRPVQEAVFTYKRKAK